MMIIIHTHTHYIHTHNIRIYTQTLGCSKKKQKTYINRLIGNSLRGEQNRLIGNSLN